ncbi:hypothetical protein QBC45DRAFT_422273 [Copromyces sp. CBS 386.78]|nr:hypothetical protein QBC45DRAFT_422273 [Copromyces sp. CBS 386.78]
MNMADHATSSRPAKRPRTETVDLTSDSEDPVAARASRATQHQSTLPASFNGDLSTLPDFNPALQSTPLSQIARLPAASTNSLLAYAATRDPYIASILQHQYDLQVARERARVISFDHYSREAWHLLNTKYARLSGSRAYELGMDVADDIGNMFEAMVKTIHQSGGADGCSFGTKKSAAETMRKIMKSVCLAPSGEISHEVRNSYQTTAMEEKLFEVMEMFDEEELARLDAEGWTEKIREVEKLAKGYVMFENLGEVVQMLEGGYEEDGEGQEGGYEEDGEGQEGEGEVQ